jgi:hypothetical protein
MSTHISEQGISLVVLQHGLWGVKGHMGYIEKKLVQKYQDSIYIVRFWRDLLELFFFSSALLLIQFAHS